MAPWSTKHISVVGIKPHKKYTGKMKRSFIQGEEYGAFLGIPYAARPEKNKECQPPEALPPDDNRPGHSLPTLDATKEGKKSPQPPDFQGSANCLNLNVYLPRDPKEIIDLLPVLVFIHGGGFTTGSNAPKEYAPDFIVREELIFVTINYRLGILGFMNTQTEEAPGNTGLKDQVEALKWIRDNIYSFRGNPNNITISGWSAGATCVNLHLISPQSRGLFHKAIVQSGGIYCPWGYRGHQYEQNRMLIDDPKFRKLLQDGKSESKKLLKRAEKLLRSYRRERHPKSCSPFFGPTLEKYTEEGFITEDIVEMMKKVDGNIPVMAGIAKGEGIAAFTLDRPEGIYKDWLVTDWDFRQVLMDNFRWSAGTAEKLLYAIRDKYFPNRLVLPRALRDRCLAKFIRDMDFRQFYNNFKFGPEKNLPENLYVYRFDHVSAISAVCRLGMPHLDEATHGDEIDYMYTRKLLVRYIAEDTEIEEVRNHLCSLWANFCRTGVPKSDYDLKNTVWRRHTRENPCFLSISKNLKLIEGRLFQDDWDWLNARVNCQPTVDSPTDTPK